MLKAHMSKEKLQIDSGVVELLLGAACLIGAIFEIAWIIYSTPSLTANAAGIQATGSAIVSPRCR